MCEGCRMEKPLSAFSTFGREKFRARSRCKPCENLNSKRRRDARARVTRTKAQVKDSSLKSKYGISLVEFERMKRLQGGKCAICGVSPSPFDKDLHVDHCHTTGAVRGLLCRLCNVGLGSFKDNSSSLLSAIKYLGSAVGGVS